MRSNLFPFPLILAVSDNGMSRKQDISTANSKKTATSVRVLRGHGGAISALHCVTRREVWDLVDDREDAGFFISGSTDCSVSIRQFHLSNLIMLLLFNHK